MNRCTRILLLAAAMFLAPCAAFAAPESAVSLESVSQAGAALPAGPEGAPAPDISPAPEALPAGDLSAGDVDESFTPPRPKLTLTQRLALQNAICALWHNSMTQNPAPVESLDLMNIDAPDHIFIEQSSGFYFEKGEWVFEGLIRQMAPDSTGIEGITAVQFFTVRFEPKDDGTFFPKAIHFDHVGAL